MKRIICLSLFSAIFLKTTAIHAQQTEKNAPLPRFKIDLMGTYGMPIANYTTANTISNYPSAISTSNTGNLQFTNTAAIGANLEAGYFFAANQHLGIGTGINYMQSKGTATLTGFRVEYKDVDIKNNIYRQIITVNSLKEDLQQTTINIPLLLKYQGRISHKLTFAADAGILFNATNNTAYKADASFDYEALYKFENSGGQMVTVYDDAVTPDRNDLQITKKSYNAATVNGNVHDIFDTLRGRGYNVALDVKNNKSGTVAHSTASIGFLFRPSASFAVSEDIQVSLGMYYTYQTFKNNTASTYRISKIIGDYETPVNSISQTNIATLGINLGISYLIK